MRLQEYLHKHYTPKTATSYERDIQAYLQHLPQAQQAVYKDVAGYLGVLRNRYSRPATLNRILCSIKAYYDYLHVSGKRKDHPARSIRLRDKPSQDIQLQDLFTPEELDNLLNRKERYILLTYRNRVLTSLLIYQALLPTELENLTTADLNLDKGEVYIKGTSKTGSRRLQLKPEQIMLFHQYVQEIRPKLSAAKSRSLAGLHENPDAFLLGHRGNPMPGEDITRHVKRSFKNLYPGRNVNAMSIRQSVITNLLKAGNDLRIVQVFAGHKCPSTTEKYKQSNLESLKAAIEQYHPLK